MTPAEVFQRKLTLTISCLYGDKGPSDPSCIVTSARPRQILRSPVKSHVVCK